MGMSIHCLSSGIQGGGPRCYNLRDIVRARFCLVLAAACLQFSCTRQTPPPLPALDLSGFQPAVREVIERSIAAAARTPGSAELAAQAGKALHAHDQFGSAVVCYQRAHLLDPQKADYLYYWGTALASDGKYEEALDPLRRALRLAPSRPYLQLKLADTVGSFRAQIDFNEGPEGFQQLGLHS